MEINFKYNPDVILNEIRERVRLWEFDKVKEDEFLANWKNLLDNATDVEINTIFLELNTGDFYYFDGTNWLKIGG